MSQFIQLGKVVFAADEIAAIWTIDNEQFGIQIRLKHGNPSQDFELYYDTQKDRDTTYSAIVKGLCG